MLSQIMLADRGSKMILNRITVDGYANVKRTTIKFEDIVSVVALNSYGKTNLLRSIELGIDFLKRNEEFSGKVTDSTPGVPININEYHRDFYFCVEGSSTWDDNPVDIKYEYQFQWGTEENEGVIQSEKLAIKAQGTHTQYKDFIIRDFEKAYRRSSPSGRCDYELKVKHTELVAYKLKAFDELFFHSIISDLLTISVKLVRHLDPRFAYRTPLFKLHNETEDLDIDKIDGDLSHALFLLQRDYPSKYNLLINTFMMLFPNVVKMEIFATEFKPIDSAMEQIYDDKLQRPDKEYRLYIYDKNVNKPVHCKFLSDGTKRILLFLSYIIISDIKNCTLVAIEEAENSIHPSLLKSFLSIIVQIAGNCRIIITSHSPYLIQYMDPMKIYIGAPNDLGVAEFRRINGKCRSMLLKDAYKYGTNIGDYIFKLIGGVDEDLETLNSYLECSE